MDVRGWIIPLLNYVLLQQLYKVVVCNPRHPKETLYVSVRTGLHSPWSFNNYLYIQVKGANGETPPMALLGPNGDVCVFNLYFGLM